MEKVSTKSKKANDVRKERFARVMTKRTNTVLEDLNSLGKCADTRSYVYKQEQVDAAFTEINKKIAEVSTLFKLEKGKRKSFSFSDYSWYFISADGGNTWTKQMLKAEEAAALLEKGFMVSKEAQQTASDTPTRIKVIAVYDHGRAMLSLYSTSPHVAVELVDISSRDPQGVDGEARTLENETREAAIRDACENNELFHID